MNVLYVFADQPHERNCSIHNCWRPAGAVNKIEGHQALVMHIDQFTKNDEATQKIVGQTDMIVIERNLFGDTLTVLQYWKVRNRNFIAIFDDAYDIMHPKNIAYPFWTHGEVRYKDESEKEIVAYMNPKPLEQFKWGLRMVKGIQVPSRYLAEDWSKYNTTYHIPNYIEFDKYLDIKPLYPHKDIVIGWGGSLSHLSSFTDSGVLKALKRISRKYKKVKIMLCGDRRVFDALDIPEGRKIFQPFVPEKDFLPLLKTFDIALAPLFGEYDKRRSWIKVLEYMALQIPWISSDFPTYEAFKNFGIMTNNTFDDWEEKLIYMIENLEERREFAKGKPFEFASTQSYDVNIGKTLELYKKIMEEPYKT